MTTQDLPDSLCPDDRLAQLLTGISEEAPLASGELDECMREYPGDPRLHFLRGSLLAAARDYGAAQDAMRHAVDLAPDYAIARFQLGFLKLTCGDGYGAQEVWGPLHGLPAGNYLRIFARGLGHLIRDEFDSAIDGLQQGILCNEENPALNHDMQLIIDEVRNRDAGGSDDQPHSSVHLLLQQSALKDTRH